MLRDCCSVRYTAMQLPDSIYGRRPMTNILHTSHQDDTISVVNDNIDTLLTNARPRLLHLAHAQGVPPDAAEDVIQETLLEAWRHLDALRHPDRFDAWLNG